MGDELDDLLPAPDVVPGRQHVHTGGEQFLGALRIDAGSVADVLAIGDDQGEAFAIDETRQEEPDGLPARFSHHVAEEEDLHIGSTEHRAPSTDRWLEITGLYPCSVLGALCSS